MKLHELRKKNEEQLILLYRDKLTEIRLLKKEMERLNKYWRDFYRHKDYNKEKRKRRKQK